MKKFIGSFLFCLPLFSGSLQLANNSPYALSATVQSADGSYLGEVTVPAGQTVEWSDENGPGPEEGVHLDEPTQSLTPYTVLWYCPDGGNYSICEEVAEGGMAVAGYCNGNRFCKQKKQGQQAPAAPEQGSEEY